MPIDNSFIRIVLCFSLIIYTTATDNDGKGNKDISLDEDIRQFIESMNADYKNARKSILNASWYYELTRNKFYLNEKMKNLEEYDNMMKKGSEQADKFKRNIKGCRDNTLRDQFQMITRLIASTLPVEVIKKMDLYFSEADNVYKKFEAEEDSSDILEGGSLRSQGLGIRWTKVEKFEKDQMVKLFIWYHTLLSNISTTQGLDSPLQVLSREEGISLTKLGEEGYKIIKKLKCLFQPLYYLYNKRIPLFNQGKHPEWETIDFTFIDVMDERNPKLKPFENTEDLIRERIQKKSITIDWVQIANNYYSSIGFEKLNQTITDKIIKTDFLPSNRKIVRVWNLFDGDYRMSWTPTDPEEDVKNIFKGVGIIQNVIQFRNLPPINQNWPNEIFQEAIAGAASMSALSLPYLRKIGILQTTDNITYEVIINYQMKNILKLLTPKTLPLGVITDTLTLKVYDNKLTVTDFPVKWWKMIKKILQLDRHIKINDYLERRFSPGIVVNMIYGSSHVKALLSEILKYQFFQQLCITAGQFNPNNPDELPLFMCDISFKGDNAIQLLKSVMQQGNTLTWEATFRSMTGQDNFDIQPLLNYYSPLIKWFKVEVPDEDPIRKYIFKFSLARSKRSKSRGSTRNTDSSDDDPF